MTNVMRCRAQPRQTQRMRCPQKASRNVAARALKPPDKKEKDTTTDKPQTAPAVEIAPKVPKAFAQVAAQKLLDTGDDVMAHARRLFRGSAEAAETSGSFSIINGEKVYQSNKPIILVLGYGWAAHSFSKVVDIDKFDIVVVSPRNHFIFTPMLPSTAVGSVEFRSLLEPVRSANPYLTYFEAKAESIDLKNHTAVCVSAPTASPNVYSTKFRINYDYILIGIGEQSATFGTPGVREHCFFMKEVSDSVKLRKRVAEQFEAAEFANDDEQKRNLLRFVVVGGGPTGVEFAGTLSDFLFQDMRAKYRRLAPFSEVVLVQSGANILPVFDSVLQQRAAANLERLRVTVLTGTKVTEVTANSIALSNGQTLQHGLCVWSTGNAARPITIDLVNQLPEQEQFKSRRESGAKLAVDDYMRIIGAERAFAAGDCSKIVREMLPPTAQVAGQEGAYIARTINRNTYVGRGGINEEAPYRTIEAAKDKEHEHEFDFLSLGIMAYIGQNKAVMQIDMNLDVNVWGQFAFFLWRSVYITKQVSMRNRVLILFDWMKSRVFGRDISLF